MTWPSCLWMAASARRAPSWMMRVTVSPPKPVPATCVARWWLRGRSFMTTAWCGEGLLPDTTLPHLLHTETQGALCGGPSPCPPLSPSERDRSSGLGRCSACLEPTEGTMCALEGWPGCTPAPASPPPLLHPNPTLTRVQGPSWHLGSFTPCLWLGVGGPHCSPAEGACPSPHDKVQGPAGV